MNGLRVAEAAALGHAHRVHVADEVRHRGVRGGQLLGVAGLARDPDNRQRVAFFLDAALRSLSDGVQGVFAQLGVGDGGHVIVEKLRQSSQQAGLALATLAEQHDVVARDDRALDLGQHGVLEAVQARPGVLASLKLG